MKLEMKKGKPFVPQYLNAILKLGDNLYYKWLLKNGRGFGKFEVKDKHKQIYKENRHLGKSKQCYHSAQMLACYPENNKIEYYEGFYVTEFKDGSAFLPLEHAWCVIDGDVIDLVAYKNKMVVREYFGVPLDKDMVRKHHKKTGMSEALLWQSWRMENGRKEN